MKLIEFTQKLLKQANKGDTVISAQIILSDGTKIEQCTYDNGFREIVKGVK